MIQFEGTRKGVTYKSKTDSHTIYTTINHDDDGNIFEIFVRVNDPEIFEVISLVTIFSSMLLQLEVDPIIVAKRLQEVHSPITRHIIPKTNIMCPSVIARIGMILEDHIKGMKK